MSAMHAAAAPAPSHVDVVPPDIEHGVGPAFAKHCRRRPRRPTALAAGCLLLAVSVLAVAAGGGAARGRAVGQSENGDALCNSSTEQGRGGLFPPYAFTRTERQHGAIALHVLGLVYMFVALAIVCDEFFVPALGVITEKLRISDDVAGATFMAAGGSAPEFFTSVIGVFISHDNVGIGTIVGSATFNILCVLAFCTLFSRTVLTLTWWPLFRDVTFYIVALALVVLFFLDEKIEWHEALILLLIYVAYCTFMKFNVQLEAAARRFFLGEPPPQAAPVQAGRASDSDSFRRGGHRRSSQHGMRHSGAMFRHGIVQLMVHTLDPLAELPKSRFHEHVRRGAGVAADGAKAPTGPQYPITVATVEQAAVQPAAQQPPPPAADDDEDDEPLDLTWPSGARKRITYLLLAPIVFALAATVPDVRKPRWRNWYQLTFVMSIVWIGAFSYCMVWWAAVIGDTLQLPVEVMALTVLAAGTSIPDLITSVIVARKGLGDMAVSSSIGSNIFDVCMGLPLPWLLYFAYQAAAGAGAQAIHVGSRGLICSVGMLFVMLIVLIIATGISGWKMSKAYGVIMIFSYVVFCVVSVLLEMSIITCPLRTKACG